MRKKQSVKSTDFETAIMTKVKSREITMRPRWHFVIGSVFMVFGLGAISIGVVFLTNVMLFLIRRHGPNGQWRLQQLLDSFPRWIPLLAIIGTVCGIRMLRAYDFSYKKNFVTISIGFIFVIVLTAFGIDYLGLNEYWSRRGPMRRFYQQIEGQYQKPTPYYHTPIGF